MTTVDLLVPELSAHDATGSHTLLLRDVLRDEGAAVRFVTQTPTVLDESVTLVNAWDDPGDVVILQHGIGSLVADAVIKRRVPVVVNYHNITPIQFVEPWDAEHITGLRWGRTQIHHLAPLAHRAICDSAYNRRDLVAAGYPDVRVAPVLWRQPEPLPRTDDPAEPVLLFVGRVAANKCHEDLIATLAVLADEHPNVRLVLVGSDASAGYRRALDAYARTLGVADRVSFTGPVSDEELQAWYARASVFVCLSEHEGFCVPVVEAMAAGVPVVAFSAAAVPETVADAGVVLADKRPATVAAAVSRVLDDPELSTTLAERARARAADFDLDRTRRVMRDALVDLVAR